MYPAWLSAKVHLVPWTSCRWTLGTMGGWTLGTMSGWEYVVLEPPVFPVRGKDSFGTVDLLSLDPWNHEWFGLCRPGASRFPRSR